MYKKILALLGLLCVVMTASATDLMMAYRDALRNDPVFRQAEATYLAIRQNYPIALANTLPSLIFTGSTDASRILNNTTFPAPPTATTHAYTLELAQPVFNMQQWLAVRGSTDSIKAAEANYYTAAQDLMTRVANAYFDVLNAEDTLQSILAELKANERQLDLSKQRFKVGLDPITTVYNSQAQYDATVANKIAAENDIANRYEGLRRISGVRYTKLARLNTKKMPLVRPRPNRPESWVHDAVLQNYGVLAALYTSLAAKTNISINRAGHLPTATVFADFTGAGSSGPAAIPNGGEIAAGELNTGLIGVRVNFPIFQSGLVVAQTRQAEYNYIASKEALRFAETDTQVNTRQAFNDVINGISLIKANRQAVASGKSSLDSTEAGYKVGTRTILDVLEQIRNLFASERSLSSSNYDYLRSTLRLKQLSGILDEKDLQVMNSWMDESLSQRRIS